MGMVCKLVFKVHGKWLQDHFQGLPLMYIAISFKISLSYMKPCLSSRKKTPITVTKHY